MKRSFHNVTSFVYQFFSVSLIIQYGIPEMSKCQVKDKNHRRSWVTTAYSSRKSVIGSINTKNIDTVNNAEINWFQIQVVLWKILAMSIHK